MKWMARMLCVGLFFTAATLTAADRNFTLRLLDKDSGQPINNAVCALYQEKSRGDTGMYPLTGVFADGNYSGRVPKGTYLLKIAAAGYPEYQASGIAIKKDSARTVHLQVRVSSFSSVPDPRQFRSDGNLYEISVATQSGSQRFVVNEGFSSGANYDKIFGSSIARAVGGATALYHDDRRRHVASEVLVLLAQMPVPDRLVSDHENQVMLQRLDLSADLTAEVTKYLDAFKANYWSSVTKGAALQNIRANALRSVSHRTADGRVLSSVNLQALGTALTALQVTATVSDVAIGAMLRAAVSADEALDRLALLEDVLGNSADPIFRQAFGDARALLTLSDTFFGALLAEITNRRGEVVQKALPFALKATMKALAMKGTLGLILVYESIVSAWDQHDTAQVSVMAATIEDLIVKGLAAGSWSESPRCELENMAAMARFTYFDRMAEACSVLQGYWVDLLKKGSPYRDARDYFTDARKAYAGQFRDCPMEPMVQAGSGGGLDIALIIDSSGSMTNNDPSNLRKTASNLFVDRFTASDRGTIIDFDNRAVVLADGESDPGRLKAAIARIDSDGGTDIGLGLRRAYEALAARSGPGRKGAILMTDGIGDYNGEAELFKSRGWPVYTIGLGNQTNEQMLSHIAISTGGAYHKARTAAVLQQLFNIISSRLSNQTMLGFFRGRVAQGQQLSHVFQVDDSVRSLLLSLSWPGSDLDMLVTDPGGRTYTPVIRDKTYEITDIKAPVAGQWRVEIKGVQVSAGGEPYDLAVSADAAIKLEPSGLNRQYRPNEPLRIYIPLPAFRNFSGNMQITRPDNSTVSLTGTPLDQGLEFSFADTRQPGDYTLEYSVSGKSRSGQNLTRAGIHTLHFSGKPYEPGLGRVTRVEGSYIHINLGRSTGVRTGIKVSFYSDAAGRALTAEGFVTEVKAHHAIVELQAVLRTEPRVGMLARLDPLDWKAD